MGHQAEGCEALLKMWVSQTDDGFSQAHEIAGRTLSNLQGLPWIFRSEEEGKAQDQDVAKTEGPTTSVDFRECR